MIGQSESTTEIPSEYLTWEHWEDPVRPQQAGLSDATQAVARAAVRGLRREFGEGWIASAVMDFHPFVQMMTFHSLFNWTYLAEVVAAIDAIKAAPGADLLIQRLARTVDCLGAIPELDIASRLAEARYNVLLHPLVRGVRPDICVQIDRPMHIEVAAIHAGPNPADQTLHGIIPAVMAVGDQARISGRIHRPIPLGHLPFVRAQIKQTALEAVSAGEVRQLREEEFEFAFFPTRILDQLDETLRVAACEGIAGPHSRWSPSARATRRLSEEFRQIPPGARGVVVLYDRTWVEEEWLDLIAQEIANTLRISSQTAAAVFITRCSLRDTRDIGIHATPYGWIVRRPVILPTWLEHDPRRPRMGRETALVVRNGPAGTFLDDETLLRGLLTTRLAF